MPLIRLSKPTRPFRSSLTLSFALLTPASLLRRRHPNLSVPLCSHHPKTRRMGSIASTDVMVNTTPPFRVLVAGGSYAGLSTALNLLDLCGGRAPRCGPQTEPAEDSAPSDIAVDITIVDERDGFYHLIGSPLALASESYAEKAWVRYDDIPALQAAAPNVRVVQGSLRSVDPERKTAVVALHADAGTTDAATTEVPYDYFVTATGLRRVWPVVPQSLRRKQYLFEAGDHIRNVTNARHDVVVVGGGAVGIEMAAELKLVQPHIGVTLVHSRDKLLSAEPLPDETKDRALELVHESGVSVLMSHRLETTEKVETDDGSKCFKLGFTNGHSMLASEVIMAISKSVPSTTFLPKAAVGEDGYVKIHAKLSLAGDIPNASDHFAVGDLVSWSGIKRCGAAMHMGYNAAANIHQLMNQKLFGKEPEFQELAEIPPMIGLAVGKNAVAYWPAEGTTSGDDVMQAFFGDDLGFKICWNHLQLGGNKVI